MAYQAGQKLGNYQLVRFLGQGGFAEVYLGKHIYLNTQAAIKVLQKQSNDEALERFLQEARIIAGLTHPHIVGVLEFGIEEQHPFLVMPYASHGTLRRRYRRDKALSPAIILPHIQQVAEALQYAHERKIVHRDVKPENMLLDANNTVLLSDFGLALRERSTYHSVHSTDSAGTTLYMAPEQLKGKPCAASDQYALGVVMYEWLCGCLPFDGPDISIVVQHLHESPEPLREHVPTLLAEIEAVVLKALEKDPKQRFATVRELAAAFAEACKSLPIIDNPVSLIGDAQYEVPSLFSVEPGESQQEAVSGEVIKLLPDFDQSGAPMRGGGVVWPSHYSSLQAPSLSASLEVNTSSQNIANESTLVANGVADVATASSRNESRISRRAALVGIAGIGVVLGGVGIWRLSSSGSGPLSQVAQIAQGSSATLPPGVPSKHQVAGGSGNSSTSGTQGTVPSSVSNNGIRKSGTTNPVTTGKSGATGTSTPSTSSSSSSNPAGTSTPGSSGSSSGVTPVATASSGAPQTVPLTVQINNPPSSVQNNTTTSVSIQTNMGNIPFQFEADYAGLKNSHKLVSPDIINGTTDGSGAATISWSPSLPPGQVILGTYADLHMVATDQNGNEVSAPSVRVDITLLNLKL